MFISVGGNYWTPGEIVTLRTMWEDGQGAAVIGNKLKKSKNAIIGKAFRIGLKAHVHANIKTGKPLLKEIKKTRSKQADRYNPHMRTRKKAHTNARVAPVLTGCRKIPMLELKENDCRFPYGDTDKSFRFCGAPREKGSSYCGHHHHICYTQAGGKHE